MGQISMEIFGRTGSALSGNQQSGISKLDENIDQSDVIT